MNWFGRFRNRVADIIGVKESRTVSVMGTGYSGPVYPDRDYTNFVKESYMKNPIAFRCADIIGKSVASVPWETYKKDRNGDIIVTPGVNAIDKVLNRPNPQEGRTFFMLKTIVYLLLSGNAYIERVTPQSGPNVNVPKELYSHRPDRMKIILGSNGNLTGYQYSVNGKSVQWDINTLTGQSNILQLKLFHPLDDYYGLSLIEPSARDIDTSNSSMDWNKKLINKEAKPGMVFEHPGNLTDHQFERLKKQLDQNYSGADNAGENLILEGGAKAHPYALSPKDMDFLEGSRENARRMAYSFGVPPQLIGIPGDNTYSNYQEARLAFWEETIFFYLEYLKSELNNWLFDQGSSEFIDYSLDEVPALEAKRQMRWERAQSSTFLTENEKREMVNYEETEGGDVILVPATMIPLKDVGITEEDVAEDITEDEKGRIIELIKNGLTLEEAQEALDIVDVKPN